MNPVSEHFLTFNSLFIVFVVVVVIVVIFTYFDFTLLSFRLHEEILAQRALDRRLTEELLRFKTTISALT